VNQTPIHDQLMAAMNHQKPEGVSVLVRAPGWAESLLRENAAVVGLELAKLEYPTHVFTGCVLYVGHNEFAEGDHEVVMEVK
jgi:hypothetical protein